MASKRDCEPLQRKEVLNSNITAGSIERSGHRRNFLHRIAGLVGILPLGALGLSQRSGASRAANAAAKRAAKSYSTPAQVREVIQRHATELIHGLENEGYLSHTSLAQLPLEKIHLSIESYTDATEGVLVSASPVSSEPTVRIHVKVQGIDGQELVVQVDPHSGLNRAVTGLDEENGGKVFLAETDVSGDVGLMGCETCDVPFDYECGQECTLSNCGCVKYAIRDFSDCIDPDCGGCFVSDHSCCGSYSCS